jgi:hypothetical protein
VACSGLTCTPAVWSSQSAELVRTDNGEHGDLLTPQARDAAITAGWEADRRRLHPGSMGTQESGQLSG